MLIETFHIDSFGLLQDVHVEKLAPGLSIFLGRNEAGKSTCLEFLRTMLFGYKPEIRKKFADFTKQNNGGQLVLRLADQSALFLTRRPRKNSDIVSLNDEVGNKVELSELEKHFSHVNRDVYCSVFGFNLAELSNFANFGGGKVNDALYGTSFGPGLRTPSDALNDLTKRMNAIFTKNASKKRANEALFRLEEISKEIAGLEAEQALYDSLNQKLNTCRNQLNLLQQNKNNLEQARRKLERRLDVWSKWDEWTKLGHKLQELAKEIQYFPEEGKERLARLQEARERCERDFVAQETKKNIVADKYHSLQVNDTLLAVLPDLERLIERRKSYEEACKNLPRHNAHLYSLEQALKECLGKLGADWTCERIRNNNALSLVSRDDLEKQSLEMTLAYNDRKTLTKEINQTGDAIFEAEMTERQAEEKLKAIPLPHVDLDEQNKDDLRQTLTRFEEALRRRPTLQQEAELSQATFKEAWTKLHLSADADKEPHAVLQTILHKQQEAVTLIDSIQAQQKEAEESNRCVLQAEEKVNAVQGQLTKLKQNLLANCPERETLEAQAKALNKLKNARIAQEQERTKLQELEQLATAEIKAETTSFVPILIGIVLLLVGGGTLLLQAFLHISKIVLSPELIISLDMQLGYGLLFCGSFCLILSLFQEIRAKMRVNQEKKRRQDQIQAVKKRLAELEEDIQNFAQQAGIVDDIDDISIEATEVRIEMDKTQCLRDENVQADLLALQEEQEKATQLLDAAQNQAREKNNAVQQTRKQWHDYMLSLQVQEIPTPEVASAFFARVETTSSLLDALQKAQNNLKTLQEEIAQMVGRLQEFVPSVSQIADSSAREQSLIENSYKLLEDCRNAEVLHRQRMQAEANLENCRKDLERLKKRQTELLDNQRKSEEQYQQSVTNWNNCVQKIGLQPGLSPQSVKEAFSLMDECLKIEKDVLNARSILTQIKEVQQSFEKPLLDLLNKTKNQAVLSAEGVTDWLATLDRDLADARKMQQINQEKESLASRLQEEEQELQMRRVALQTAQNNEKALLQEADVNNTNDFLRLAQQYETKKAWQSQRQNLEADLHFAAGKEKWEDFLNSFQENNEDEQKALYADLEAQISKLETEQMEPLRNEIADINARKSGIENDDILSTLRQEYAELKESIKQMALEWAQASLAKNLLERAKRKFETERQPKILCQASEIFAQITDRRWQGIVSALEEQSLRMQPAQGIAVARETLSRGTQEQAYLALRLAYIQNHASQAEPLPLLMDEILVNFDRVRATNTAQQLARMTGEETAKPHQILYFTCHEQIANLLCTAQPKAKLFSIENGTISVAN